MVYGSRSVKKLPSDRKNFHCQWDKLIIEREGNIIKAATSDKVLGSVRMPDRDMLRAAMLKNMLASLLV